MKRKIRTLLSLLLAAVFLVSTGLMLRQYFSDRDADTAYEEAQRIARSGEKKEATEPSATLPQPGETVWVPAPVEEEDPHMQELAQLDLEALREMNPDVIGWIRIPDTKVDYPFLQGEDNDYYLKNTWDHQARAAGSIFMECRNSADLTDFNTILYGHNMQSGAMFASLRSYSTQEYFEKHPYVYILTDAGVWRYEVFAAYKAPVDSFTYGLSFQERKTREYFLQGALIESQIDAGIAPPATDRILTLSTCSAAGYSTRWVVQARLKMVELEG